MNALGRKSHSAIAVALAASLMLPRVAIAEPSPEDRAAAEVLFRDAKALMNQKKWPEACRKLEESQRLDPQGGTLLNLAVCHAREGKSASAWVEFQEARDLAKQVHRDDRVRLANRELGKLDSALARLSVEVPSEARVPGLSIRRDGEVVGEGAFGTAIPVDPGVEIALEARAPGYRTWNMRLTVRPMEQKTIVVPKLEKAPEPPAAKPAPKPAPPATESTDTRRTMAYVAGGVGVVALGVGGYFGLRALSKKHASDDHCQGNLCDPEGLDLNHSAKSAATVADVAFGVGIVALAAGTYLYLTSTPANAKPPEAEKAAFRVSPSIAPGSGGMLLSGRW